MWLKNKLSPEIILVCIFLNACSQKPKTTIPTQIKKHFTTFEISYKGGWIGGLSFLVDSNKIYLAPNALWQPTHYGLLPDSIFNKFNGEFYETISDTAIKSSIKIGCCDMSEVAIKVVTGKDTIRIYQEGNINNKIFKIVDCLEQFLIASKQDQCVNLLELETYKLVAPTPPIPPRFLEDE